VSLSDLFADAALSTSSDAIIAADEERIIRFWNHGAERIFGYSTDRTVGQSLDIIIPERLRMRHWDGYHQVMEKRKSRYGNADVLSVPGVSKDGVMVSIEFTIAPLRDGAGQLIGIAAIMRDVTGHFEEMRVLKERLSQATKPPGLTRSVHGALVLHHWPLDAFDR
jgi:PAS domain S-box-containing protein